MKTIAHYSLFVLLVTALFSCSSPLHEGIEGLWVIEKAQYEGKDIVRCMSVNAISFKKNKCEFPSLFSKLDCPQSTNAAQNGIWKIIDEKERVSIILKISNSLFDGDYQIRFYEEEKQGKLSMQLSSEKLTLYCSKALFDYRRNKDLATLLVEKTNQP